MAPVCLFMLFAWPTLSVKTVKSVTVVSEDQGSASRPVTKIVKMLKDMAEKSEADGEAEADTFKKYECFSTKMIENKTASIADLTETIEMTETDIEKLTALASELAKKQTKAEADLVGNEQSQSDANATRNKSHTLFLKEEADMSAGLAQLTEAYNTLAAVGPQEAAASLLEKSKDPSLLSVKKMLQVTKLRGASPGNYESQSGGVLGVLKSTKDTYAKNLEDLRAAEANDVTSYESLVKTLTGKEAELNSMLEMINSSIVTTSEDLATKRSVLKSSQTDLESESAIKAETEKTLAQKTKTYEDRSLLRTQENSAISQAIAVLNSDSAFDSFGKVSSTDGAAFLQLQKKHTAAKDKQAVLTLLSTAAKKTKSARLAHLLAVADANPFSQVLKEIDGMQSVIAKEAKADLKQKTWCESETSTNTATAADKKSESEELTTEIFDLKTTIENDVDGLQKVLDEAKSSLEQNEMDQKEQTASRTKENQDYQQNVANLQVAIQLLEKSTKILTKYYDKISLLQRNASYDEGEYGGQSGSGNQVITLLDNIMTTTKTEEADAHAAENTAQKSFEDAMAADVTSEENLKATITKTTKSIADTRLLMDQKSDILTSTKEELASVKKYLAEIKPACDFIKTNFADRDAARVEESKALANAIDLIKATPAYQAAEEKAASTR
eukprot:CAMPEP_0197658100 /NCGR_PEP_ID=MMETSP1338-20131121/45030_1 /TAXON_ID=43686 ORGANISM="Pelagodinium beii, Strain RCC1491" /NCGR_SAMPLE_ID=MMETSP1338 /ASSEMBLY_ACC=CAM_ASM_000754 /LENGTH=671 /DNA_ID=CAMNT_0043234611 /DNA_START=68 /DNA_END=2083 /DNA_ORIENTATION=-